MKGFPWIVFKKCLKNCESQQPPLLTAEIFLLILLQVLVTSLECEQKPLQSRTVKSTLHFSFISSCHHEKVGQREKSQGTHRHTLLLPSLLVLQTTSTESPLLTDWRSTVCIHYFLFHKPQIVTLHPFSSISSFCKSKQLLFGF